MRPEKSLEVTAADYDCPMMYYDYSTDGGRTYSELLPWPGLDIMAGTYPDYLHIFRDLHKGGTAGDHRSRLQSGGSVHRE